MTQPNIPPKAQTPILPVHKVKHHPNIQTICQDNFQVETQETFQVIYPVKTQNMNTSPWKLNNELDIHMVIPKQLQLILKV